MTDKIHDLTHPCLDDVGQVLYTDLFCRHAAQAGNGNIGIGLCLVGQCGTELHFHLFGLGLEDAETGFYIVK